MTENVSHFFNAAIPDQKFDLIRISVLCNKTQTKD